MLVWQENTAFDCILNIITKKEYPNPPTTLPTPWVYQRPFFQANGNLFGKLQVRLLHWRFGDFQCLLTFLMFRPWDSIFGRLLLQWRWLLMIETLRLFKFRWFWCSVSPQSPSAIPPSQFWTCCFFKRKYDIYKCFFRNQATVEEWKVFWEVKLWMEFNKVLD